MTQQLQQLEWNYLDFPHICWPSAIVEVNGELVIPQLVEFGRASTGQRVCVVTFDDGSRLDVWLDPDFPRSHQKDYAIWKRSPFHDLTLSTCPAWRVRRCGRCQVDVELWSPPDQIIVDLRFCERDDHRRMPVNPHAHLVIRNHGFIQKRLGAN
ncbi:hypothetical protein MUP01_04070 [Candidatus Bathyarchaeota archaeon]|nr:hypothetical protein [Candidatus Bathyarchaeota archaeon]